MKILHLADLHIGKVVNRFSLLEDQKYILEKVLEITDREKPDTVIIAGDVYDRSTPSAEAVEVFDDFLFDLAKRNLNIIMCSGNHDSAERIAFASRILKHSNVYVSPVYNGKVEAVKLNDDEGDIFFYLLPFIKPSAVRNAFPDEEIKDYTDAVRVAVSHMNVDYSKRNVLVSHQFVTGAELAGSEERSIGGSENVDVSVIEQFDYVALGHIHKAQSAGKKHVRYCGSMLKYTFDEADQEKSVTLVEIGEKGKVEYSLIPLTPLREMKIITGTYDEVMHKGLSSGRPEDYVKVILTDESDVPDAIKKLRTVYPNIMQLAYDNTRTRNLTVVKRNERVEKMSPFEILEELFAEQNGGRKLSNEQADFSKKIIDEIWGKDSGK